MTLAWMVYVTALTALLGLAARAAEAALDLYGRPLRWAWALAAAGALVPLATWAAAAVGLHPWGWLGAAAAETGGRVLLPPGTVTGPAPGTSASWLASLGRALDGLRLPATGEAWILRAWAAAAAAGAALGAGTFAWLARRRRRGRSRRVGRARVALTPDLGPLAAGVIRACVYMPRWVLRLDPAGRRAAWLHEREHIEAGDPLLLTGATLLALLVPWNLPLWWILGRLRQAVEVDCDRRVLERRVDSRRYGDLLLEVGRRGARPPLPAAALVTPERSLERRIRSMTRCVPHDRLLRALGLVAAGGLVLAAACETPAPNGPPDASASQAPTAPADSAAGASASGVSPDHPKFVPRDRDPALLNVDSVITALQRDYPAELRDAGIGGRTVLWMLVDANGNVTSTRVQRSSGHAALDSAAMQVGGMMRFRPADNHGQAIAVWIAQPIIFESKARRSTSDASSASAPGAGDKAEGRSTMKKVAGVPANALVLVDGRRLTRESELRSLDAANIQCISVLKGAAARALYGDDALDGVILVHTKADAGGCSKG
jgi:TonB family protein